MHDDCVVYHDANSQDQAQHRNVVERKSHVVHEQERRYNRCRYGKSGNHGCSPISDEQKDRGTDQYNG